MKIKATPFNKKKDDRGWLIENESDIIRNSMRHFLVSVSKPGAIRGQHYHKKKKEWFIVVKGKAEVVFEDIRTKEMARITVNGEEPKAIETFPLVAHAFKNIGKEDMFLVAIVNEPLDKKDPDTFPYKII